MGFAKTFFADRVPGCVEKALTDLGLGAGRLQLRACLVQDRLSIPGRGDGNKFSRQLGQLLQDRQPFVANGAWQPILYILEKRFEGVGLKRGDKQFWI